jgi:hypothetical protein
MGAAGMRQPFLYEYNLHVSRAEHFLPTRLQGLLFEFL